MNKLNFLQLLLVVALGYFNTANAQNPIWGVDAGIDVANAQFSTDFIETGVAGSVNDTAWTAISISHTDPVTGSLVTPGNAYWKRDLIGYSQGAYWGGTTPHAAPSQANGSAFFDSDFYDNNGTAGAFGSGIAPGPQVGELVSPLIDLTGYTDTALTLRMYAFWRNFQSSFTVSMSTDNGLNWSAPRDVATQLPGTSAPYESWVELPFYDVTTGVANLSQCRIKITFNGNYYFACVDDISLIVAPPTEIGIGGPDAGGATWAEAGSFSKLGNHRYIPEIMADSLTGGDWLWAMKAVNNGFADILPADNPLGWIAIDYIDPVTGLVTADVYKDSSALDTLLGGAANFRLVQQNLSDLSFLSTYGAGNYQVKYWVSSDVSNPVVSNDTVFQTFTITDENAPLKNYLSKVRLNAAGDPAAARGLFPGGGPYAGYEMGSVFYFARGATDSISIDSIKFRYYIPSTYTGNATAQLVVNVYEWTDLDGNFTVNDDTELLNIGLGVAQLSGLSSAGGSNYGRAVVSSIVDPGTGNPLGTLGDGKYYYVSLASFPSIPAFEASNHPWFGADNFYDYSYNYGLQLGFQPVGVPTPLKLTDAAGTATWYSSGFGLDDVPAIGLFLDAKTSATSTAPVEVVEGVSFSVYPNPATELVNVEVNLDEAQDISYIVTDNTGRIIFFANANNVTNDVRSLNVSQFPAGVYHITAKTANGESTQRFVKK